MLIPNKFNGYSRDGRREYHIGGGGGGGGDSKQTQVTDLPDWAKPTAQKQLALAESVTDINKNPFQSYGDFARQKGMDPTQVAGFRDLQNRAFTGAENLQPSAAMGAGMGIAGAAAGRALNMGYNPYQAQNQYQSIEGYNPSQFSNQFQGPGAYQAGQFDPERVRADVFGGRQAAQYMSPYIEQAMAPQLREAQRASEIQRNADQARAVGQGAFGGSRQAIVEAERQRNLGTQMGDIRARGLQSAYEQATQQFNQDAARRMQAQQLNQQSGLSAQQLAEQSRQFGAGQGMTAAQLQAQYGLSAQQAQEAANQFGYGQAAQQAAQRAQYGQSAQQLAEQSRQFGGSLGIQGIQAALQGAGQLGSLGGQQFGQQKDILGLQNQFGTQQQQQEQALINARMADFQAQQRYPYQQLEFMSNILRGTPMGTVQSMYAQQPGIGQQVLGAGTSLAGAYMMGGGRFAEGGSVADQPAGLAELALSRI